jgi:hypothetical protein
MDTASPIRSTKIGALGFSDAVRGYTEALLWAGVWTDEEDSQHVLNAQPAQIRRHDLPLIRRIVRRFLHLAQKKELLQFVDTYGAESLGRHIYFDSADHGVGFWSYDEKWPGLTSAARKLPECYATLVRGKVQLFAYFPKSTKKTRKP